MSRQHLKQFEKAQSELRLGHQLIENKFRNGLDRGSGTIGFWFDWEFACILQREAAGLIEKSSSGHAL